MGSPGDCDSHLFAHFYLDIAPHANRNVYRHAHPFGNGDSHIDLDSHTD
jgi:hypothetical protein